jgi:hypothetical protein
VIFTVVVATFFILMAFQINLIGDELRHFLKKYQNRKEAPEADIEFEEEDFVEKIPATEPDEGAANRWSSVKRRWNSLKGGQKVQEPSPA